MNNHQQQEYKINYSQANIINSLNLLIDSSPELKAKVSRPLMTTGMCFGLVLFFIISKDLLKKYIIMLNHCDKTVIKQKKTVRIDEIDYTHDQILHQLSLLVNAINGLCNLQGLMAYSTHPLQAPLITQKTVTELNNELKKNNSINPLHQWQPKDLDQYVSSIAGLFTRPRLTEIITNILNTGQIIEIASRSHSMAITKDKSNIVFYDPNDRSFTKEFNSVDQLVDPLFKKRRFFMTKDKNGKENIALSLDIFSLLKKSNINATRTLLNQYWDDHWLELMQGRGILFVLYNLYSKKADKILKEAQTDNNLRNIILNNIFSTKDNPENIYLLGELLIDDLYEPRADRLRNLLDKKGILPKIIDFINNNFKKNTHNAKYINRYPEFTKNLQSLLFFMVILAIRHNEISCMTNFFITIINNGRDNLISQSLASLALVNPIKLIHMINKGKNLQQLIQFLNHDNRISHAIHDNIESYLNYQLDHRSQDYVFPKIPERYTAIIKKYIKAKTIELLAINQSQTTVAQIYNEYKKIKTLLTNLKKRNPNIIISDNELKNTINAMKVFVHYMGLTHNDKNPYHKGHFWNRSNSRAQTNPKLIKITARWMNQLASGLKNNKKINFFKLMENWQGDLQKTGLVKHKTIAEAFERSNVLMPKAKVNKPSSNNMIAMGF